MMLDELVSEDMVGKGLCGNELSDWLSVCHGMSPSIFSSAIGEDKSVIGCRDSGE